MPDWEALVSEQFAAISLEPEERGEVIAELAGHLEETFEQLRRQGLTEESGGGARALASKELAIAAAEDSEGANEGGRYDGPS